MTREESKMMQGVAILIMIFYHLFNPHDAAEYTGTVIGKIAMANNPVPFYVFLSGYGLYRSYASGGGKSNFSRSITLYGHYWLVLTAFLIVSYTLHDNRCHLTTSELISNYLGIKSTYYLPSWFILPYSILILASGFIFNIIKKTNNIYSFVIGYTIYFIAAYLNRNTWFQANAFQVLYIIFPFILGALAAKTEVIEKTKIQIRKHRQVVPIILILMLIIIRVFLPTGAIISLYAAAFITLFATLRKTRWIENILLKLGKANLNMWMIHAWICWYLFREEVYNIGNPLLIFISVTISSYILAIFFEYIYKAIILINKSCLLWIKRI